MSALLQARATRRQCAKKSLFNELVDSQYPAASSTAGKAIMENDSKSLS